MPTSPLSVVIQHLMADLGPDGGGRTDGELLARFLSSRDDNALAALVRRHAPMVWGVCCRLLRNHHDAEDAFQATFLVLVRKAADVPGQAVANWVHGVARQTAVRLRATAAKKGRRETQVVNMPEPTVAEVRDADWKVALDEELSRLPDHYRGVLVLCDLEGMTRKETARQLGIPEGSVASRLARARVMLAKRLTQRGVVLSGGSVAAALSAGAVSASAPPALVASTIRAASLFAAGKAAATAVISARVAALTKGVVRAMFLAKLKTGTCAFALTVLVGLGGVALVPGSDQLPVPGPATPPQAVGEAKPDAEAHKLVRQLGSPSFAERQEADKALASQGARAAASVRAGMGDADPEVAKRCTAIWPRLWETEIARPDADRLAGYTHPLWARFRKAAGDDPGSRTLFAEMVADFNRFSRLEAVEADPEKAVAAYAAELKQRAEAIERSYQETREAQNRAKTFTTGLIVPVSGFPTRSEFVTLLFLGTYPATVKGEGAGDTHPCIFSFGVGPTNRFGPMNRAESAPIRQVLWRLYAKWLGTRTDPQPIAIGMREAVYNSIAEVYPTAVAHAANDKLAPTARGWALLAVGRFGSADDIPLLEKAFADARVFHSSNFTWKDGKQQPVETRVSDTAVAAALHLAGQKPADFGFTFLEMYKERGPDALTKHYLLGFFQDDDAARQAAHKRAREWLDKQRKDKKSSKPTAEPMKSTP
jgi:RNA polymerase sigma factor (sigma-70 family)